MSTLLIIAQVIAAVSLFAGTFIGTWVALRWLEDHYGKTKALLFVLVALSATLYSNFMGAPL